LTQTHVKPKWLNQTHSNKLKGLLTVEFQTKNFPIDVVLEKSRITITPIWEKPTPQYWNCIFESTELKRFLSFCIDSYLKIGGTIKQIKPQDKPYSEELNVYKDEIERSITTERNGFSFICYTDRENDEWTYLTKAKLRYFIELLLPSLEQKAINQLLNKGESI